MLFSLSGNNAVACARRACRIVLLAVLCLSAASAAGAQPLRGVALVIGNGDYEHLTALPNPTNDARAIESLYNRLGFRTTLVSDRDARRLARDLDIFAEDAEGADVAMIYYSGHGIEAGGENFLVPVDADLSALDAAGERLVPVSDFIKRLEAAVPVVIVMLDACRNNPFPPGSKVRLDASSAPVTMSMGGLGQERSVVPLNSSGPKTESYGTVLAFAAEPGKVALDGEPGGNSPYAVAVLRHLSAISGEEFGTVMRMVAEEVYLKTSGRQHPWVNESLRRLLYFGKAPESLDGDEAQLLSERRQLLITIAALPQPELRRRQVEDIAAQGGVPLDAVYGMLRAMGADAPKDPADLEKALRTEAERFAKALAVRKVIDSPDAEIVRLSALADKAEREGLLSSADNFRERTKARFRELEPTLNEQQAALDLRYIEGAAVFERSAGTKALAFDYLAAARDYAEAFRLVEGRDARLAMRYKRSESTALIDHGFYKADNAALDRAIASVREALRLAESFGDRENWAWIQYDLGEALRIRGSRETTTLRLKEAVAAHRAALAKTSRERTPLDWAWMQAGLGFSLSALGSMQITNPLTVLGQSESGTARLEDAVVAFRSALEEMPRDKEPLGWALTQSGLGNALRGLGDSDSGTVRLEEAVIAFRSALEEQTRETAPLDWAFTQASLGGALISLGVRENGTTRLKQAVSAYRAALEERTRERLPLEWAASQANLGIALANLGMRESSIERLEAAVAAYRAALEERTRERVPNDWASTQSLLSDALATLSEALIARGDKESGAERLKESIAARVASIEEHFRQRLAISKDGAGGKTPADSP